MTPEATLHIDGGSRGNPGPAACAAVLTRPHHPPLELAESIGTATNNVAEYTALIRGLELARDHGVRQLAVFSDSELLVKQMNGEYRVKNPELQELFRRATELRHRFDRVTVTHIRREQNQRADFLCNEALDGRPRVAGEAIPDPPKPPRASAGEPHRAAAPPKPPKVAVSDERIRAEALACLQAAARSWAEHGPHQPPVAMVWEQLWSLLAEAHLLKKR